jgi:hypothetical protein
MNDTSTPENAPLEATTTPRPTFAPVAMAMGIAMTVWGFMTLRLTTGSLWFMSVAGAAVVVWALSNWMSEIARQWRESP